MWFEYKSISDLLSAELRRRVQSNSRYSLRSFAHALKLSPGALSEILREKRDLSLRSVPNLVRALGLNAVEAQHLMTLAQNGKLGTPLPAKAQNQRQLTDEIFVLVSEWYHFAILNLLDCEGFDWKAEKIAARLGISRLQAKMAMQLLIKLGLVERKAGRIQGTREHILTSNDVPSAAVRAYHRQMLTKAMNALEQQDVSERQISGTGFAVDPDQIGAIKSDMIEFQNRMISKYGRGNKREVYFMGLSLFKLTTREKR